jgi:hypothetical protein
LLRIIISKFANWFSSILNPEKYVGHAMDQTSLHRHIIAVIRVQFQGSAYKLLSEENYTNVGTLQAGLMCYLAPGHHSTTVPVSSTNTLPESRISLLLHYHSQWPPDVCGRPHQPVPFYSHGPHSMFTFDSAFERLGKVFNIQQAENLVDRC